MCCTLCALALIYLYTPYQIPLQNEHLGASILLGFSRGITNYTTWIEKDNVEKAFLSKKTA